MDKSQYYANSTIFLKSLANPIRLEIIDLLVQGERTVESISVALDLNVKTASSYLNELFKSKILNRRKEGKNAYYSLTDKDFLVFFLNFRKLIDKNFGQNIEEKSSIRDITKKAHRNEITLLDTRPYLEYEQGHLPKSKSMPLSELKDRFLELPKGKTIYLYCRGPYCTFSEQASEFLSKKGFKTVVLKKGVLEAMDEKIKLERSTS